MLTVNQPAPLPMMLILVCLDQINKNGMKLFMDTNLTIFNFN